MKIAIFSDLHLGIHQNSDFWLNQSEKWIDWFIQDMQNQGCEKIIFCGDFFHYRDEVSVKTLHSGTILIQKIAAINVPITMITGNHDCYYKETSDVHSLSIFKDFSNFNVYDKMTTIDVDGKSFTFCPWGTSLDAIPKSDVIFGHFELQNFRMNAFKVCEDGSDPMKLISKSPLTFSGHFHSRDEKKFEDKTIVYIGNPYEMDFGDTMQRKGYYVLDTSDLSYEFIENATTPKHIKMFLSRLINLEDVETHFNEIIPNNFILLTVDKNISTEHLDALVAKITTYKPEEIRVDYDINYNKLKVVTGNDVDLSGVLIDAAIEEFVNLLDIQNKHEVIEYTVNLLQKAKI